MLNDWCIETYFEGILLLALDFIKAKISAVPSIDLSPCKNRWAG